MKRVTILKEKSAEYKGTKYYKYKINIPETVLMSAGLKAGDLVELTPSKETIQLKKVENLEKTA